MENSNRSESKLIRTGGFYSRHAGIEEKAGVISPGDFSTARTPQDPWKFTIPWLDGSMPLHSFVTLIQGVETDSV